MKTVRTYAKSEDAYIAASILGSSGVEAVVIDENSFGGNLMGSTQESAIRVEVAESKLEEAGKILTNAEAHAKESRAEVFETFSPPPKYSILFNWLVSLELAFVLLHSFFPSLYTPELSQEFEKSLWSQYLFSEGVNETMILLSSALYEGYLFLSAIAAALLVMRIRLGRILFTGNTLYVLLLNLSFSAYAVTPLGSFLGGISWMLTGAVLLFCWSPAMKEEFRKRAAN